MDWDVFQVEKMGCIIEAGRAHGEAMAVALSDFMVLNGEYHFVAKCDPSAKHRMIEI